MKRTVTLVGMLAAATALSACAFVDRWIGREDAPGQPAGGWQPQQRVTIEEALAAYTAGAAWAGFAEGRFGRLAPGERADFLVLDADPLEAEPRDLREMRVLETWIGGQKIYDASPAAERRTADAPGR